MARVARCEFWLWSLGAMHCSLCAGIFFEAMIRHVPGENPCGQDIDRVHE